PSLSSLKHHHESGAGGSSSGGHSHTSYILSTNQTSRAEIGGSSGLDRTDSPQIGSGPNGSDEKPVAVVHGKKNRLAYSNEDESLNTSIKRFCMNNDRADMANFHILLPNGFVSGSAAAAA